MNFKLLFLCSTVGNVPSFYWCFCLKWQPLFGKKFPQVAEAFSVQNLKEWMVDTTVV